MKKVLEAVGSAFMGLGLIIGTGLALTTVGCAGDRPTAFSERTRGLAEAAQGAVRKKDIKEMEATFNLADKRFKNPKNPGLTKEEMRVINRAYELAKEGNWDAANEILDKSLKIKQSS